MRFSVDDDHEFAWHQFFLLDLVAVAEISLQG